MSSIDNNDSTGFDGWGLLGHLGLASLAGLKRRNDHITTIREHARQPLTAAGKP